MTKPGLSGENLPKYLKKSDSQRRNFVIMTHTGLAKLSSTSVSLSLYLELSYVK